jgi:hypothetical protein
LTVSAAPHGSPRDSHSDGLLGLAGLSGEYPQPFTGTMRWVVLGAQVCALVSAVPQLFSSAWSARVVAAVLIAFVIVGLLMQYWRPPATVVSTQGLRVRKVLFAGHLTPWRDVTRVEVQNRWEGRSTAHTAEGRQLPLIGMSQEVAQQLAAALEETTHR